MALPSLSSIVLINGTMGMIISWLRRRPRVQQRPRQFEMPSGRARSVLAASASSRATVINASGLRCRQEHRYAVERKLSDMRGRAVACQTGRTCANDLK